MGKTFVMRWLADGKVRLSKNAPAELHGLAATGLLDQEPSGLGGPRPKNLLLKKFKKAPEGVNANNMHGVEKDQIWESLDPRHRPPQASIVRQVRILEVGATHALVQGLRYDTRSLINLKSFGGKTTREYRLVVPRSIGDA